MMNWQFFEYWLIMMPITFMFVVLCTYIFRDSEPGIEFKQKITDLWFKFYKISYEDCLNIAFKIDSECFQKILKKFINGKDVSKKEVTELAIYQLHEFIKSEFQQAIKIGVFAKTCKNYTTLTNYENCRFNKEEFTNWLNNLANKTINSLGVFHLIS